MELRDRQRHPGIVVLLLLCGMVARLVPHPWNATPTMAIALFGGTYLAKRWAVLLPLLIVGATDLFVLGWYRDMPFTWAAFALTGMLAWWIRRRPSPVRILPAALAASALFYLISNLGVWAVGGLYPQTAAGLWECYVAAIPFLRNALVGDLVYTAAFFGGYAAVTSPRLQRARVWGQTPSSERFEQGV